VKLKNVLEFLKKKDCGECKDCVVSTIKCIKGKKCQKECIWKNFENCYFKRLPPYLVKKCSKLFKDNKLKKCITNCTHTVTWKDCWRRCNKHEVVHHHSKCKRLLIKKGKKFKKCSISGFTMECFRRCKESPKECFNKCEHKKCGNSDCHCCKLFCTKKPAHCVKECVKKEMIACYLITIPPEYRNKCWSYISRNFVEKCLRKCVAKKVVTHTTKVKISALK